MGYLFCTWSSVYVNPISQFISPPLSPPVSTCPFATSVFLFLPCRQVPNSPQCPQSPGRVPPGGGALDLTAPVFANPLRPHVVRLVVREAVPRKETWLLLERG